jgi:predicted nucleic acid-binding protein
MKRVLVDTSVWIDHLRRDHPQLKLLLAERGVLTHPLVIGELACGGIKNRSTVLGNLKLLPHAKLAEHFEVLEFIEEHRLHGRGLSIVDVQLLASARLSDAFLMTQDAALGKVAQKLGALWGSKQ